MTFNTILHLTTNYNFENLKNKCCKNSYPSIYELIQAGLTIISTSSITYK